MPQFSYTAKKGPKEITKGMIEAGNKDQAITKIITAGLTPIDVQIASFSADHKGSHKSDVIRESGGKTVSLPGIKGRRRVRLNQLVMFVRQISDLADAAVPILRSLQITAKQTPDGPLKVIVEKLYYDVRDGSSFSNALSRYPDIFSNLFVQMVKVGEVGGQLDKILHRLADHMEKDQETQNKVKTSMAYPLLILVVGVLTVFVLLAFVFPRISVMFEDLDQQLPWPTLLIVTISNVFAHYWWLMLAGLGVLILGIKQVFVSPAGRLWIDRISLKIPLVGNFLKIVEVGRFSRTLATLIESGVPITSALNAVWGTIDNSLLRDEVKAISQEVVQGASLQESFARCSFFPEAAMSMISIGEQTGRLERGLYKVAQTYERQSDELIKTMISLLGPLALVVIVSVVGMVVIAMLLPIFKMNMLIQ